LKNQGWCEHLSKVSKYSILKYQFEDRVVILRVQTWMCPECGMHGADTEIADDALAAIEQPAVAY